MPGGDGKSVSSRFLSKRRTYSRDDMKVYLSIGAMAVKAERPNLGCHVYLIVFLLFYEVLTIEGYERVV
jgi:hypothetical protein